MKKRTTEEFINDAIKVHGYKYNYLKVDYINSYTKVIIICPEHGEFNQTPKDHIYARSGCAKCKFENLRLGTNKFTEKSIKIHENKYDYSLVEYKNNTTNVIIICSEHGEFEQTPTVHLAGSGCKKCIFGTTEKFINDSKEVHGDKYDYSLVDYINTRTKVKIICPKHGIFEQTPPAHKRGQRCPKCHGSVKLTTEEFIERASKLHGNIYDYSYVKYFNNNQTKIKIICKKCSNVFNQVINSHLSGQGCPKCASEKTADYKRLTTEEFIERASKLHGNIYDYSMVKYVNNYTKVEILCRKCGMIFKQEPSNHMIRNGCPYCKQSKGELKIKDILDELGIKHEIQMRFDDCRNKIPLPFDFYIPDQNLLIEFNGIQHYECSEFFGGNGRFKIQIKRDKIKVDYCKNNNIPLHIIKYNEVVEERMKEILKIT